MTTKSDADIIDELKREIDELKRLLADKMQVWVAYPIGSYDKNPMVYQKKEDALKKCQEWQQDVDVQYVELIPTFVHTS